MPSSSKHHDSSSKRHSSSKSKSSKSDNWAEVSEPEERRRIQNRLAQRKFREKAKEHKEKTERDSRNQELAGSSYQVASSDDYLQEEECSGLPWGSFSMRHVVARGHESESRRGSGRDEHARDASSQVYGQYGGYDTHRSYSYGSYSHGSHGSNSGGDFFDDNTYYYPDYDNTGSGSHS
ncbi:hypothetical protein JX265_003833 [Neoarthrinium moseri]|uniref:BZIP domain-containing protein n=1 Tax=Neoarthrinium moseri TaxID=1658444 RepID=A0A9Q0AT17_9PEZI|nr:uncharacterized protein JN550_009397 [Neoarthrinium moseri]KAI1852399.1 hypothetical protein JX266_002577 [Neoarthrinium moseri]KAI1863697.1 hypothetical protein JN550_009397 [Neoarthrinium moseri]KAI1876307.1 hypothetical protein JX265_003833 [Neoarthrinium moseri]